MAGPHEIGGAAVAVGERAHRVGALLRRDAGGQPVAHIDRDGEGGAERRVVDRDHRVEVQAPRLLDRSGAQTMPEVWRMMKAIFSGVHSEAATNRSPSFSRSSSSVTTTISPRANAATAASTRSWDSRSPARCSWSFMETVAASSGRSNGQGGARADLAPMAQIMVGEHARHHSLADRHRADADAGVVAAFGDDLGLAPVAVDGARAE